MSAMNAVMAIARLYGRVGKAPSASKGHISEVDALKQQAAALRARLQVMKHGVADHKLTQAESLSARLSLLIGAQNRIKETHIPESRGNDVKELRERAELLKIQLAATNATPAPVTTPWKQRFRKTDYVTFFQAKVDCGMIPAYPA